MQKVKKIGRFFARWLLYSVLLLLVGIAILQIPAVQSYLTGKLERYLQDKFKTEVVIESIRLRLPESLVLGGVYVEDQQQDTFLNVGELSLNFKLHKLFSKRIQFDEIALKDGTAKIYIDRDSSNFDFIVQAFSTPQDAPPPKSTDQANPWIMTFDHAGFAVQNVDFYYQDIPASLFLETHLGELSSRVRQIDYLAHNYQIEQLHLAHSSVNLEMGTTQQEEEDTTTTAAEYNIDADWLIFEKVAFGLKMPDLAFSTHLTKLENKGTTLHWSKAVQKIHSATLQIVDSDFQYDVPSVPRSKGFNPQHLNWQKINTEISDFNYDDLNIAANINQLSGKDEKGFELKKFQTNFAFSEKDLALKQLKWQTKQSQLISKHTHIQFPFFKAAETPIQSLKIDSDVQIELKDFTEITYFYPPLDSIALFQQAPKNPIKIRTELQGSLAELSLRSLNLDGFNTQLIAAGTVKNLTQVDLLEWNLNLDQLQTNKQDLDFFIPPNSLPDFVQIPDTITLTGKTLGNLQYFTSQLYAQTNRRAAPFPTQIKARASIQNLLQKDSTYLYLQLDTFSTSKADILAYLPLDAIPDYVNLPDQFILQGEVKGNIANLTSSLELLTYRDNEANQLKALGSISGLFTSDNPAFDITLDAASISRQELLAFLPDSLLPAYFQLPFIEKLSGIFKGDLGNFKTNFQLESNTGNWTVDASLNQDKYHLDFNVEEVDPESFFTPGYLDSLTGVSFLPLSVAVKLDGQGFDASQQSFSDFLVTIKSAADPLMEGLVIQGKLDDQKISANAVAHESAVDLISNFSLDYTSPVPKIQLDLLVDQLDFVELQLSQTPFSLAGKLQANFQGYHWDTLSGEALVSDMRIHYGDQFEQVDRLRLVTEWDNGANFLQLTSDVFEAKLKGVFEIPKIAAALQQQFDPYWPSENLDTLIQASDQYLDLDFALLRPEILTMGFIPELDDLSPFTLKGNFDHRKRTINVATDIPYITWQNTSIEALSVQANGQVKALDYQIGFQHANIQDIADIQRFNGTGSLEGKVLENTLQLLDEKNKARFEVKSHLDLSEQESILLSFSPEQILNYQQWNVTEGNEIRWAAEKLAVKDWRFYSQQEAIEIKQLSEEEIGIAFEKFDLKTISDIIKLNGNYLGGILNGRLSFVPSSQEPIFTSNLKIDDLVVFDALLGDLSMNAIKQKESTIEALARLRGNGNDLQLTGTFDPKNANDALDFQLMIPSLNLSTIEPLTFGYLENMRGLFNGQVQIHGSIKQPDLIGQVQFDQASFEIETLKARLRLGNQPIIFDANAIEFKDLEIFDANDQKGVISSYLLTSDYRNFFLQSNIKVNDFLILNTTAQDNDLYYGKLLVDANVNLSGNIKEPTIEVSAKPKKASNITYVYSAVSNQLESHEGIVEFVIPQEDQKRNPSQAQLIQMSENLNMKVIVKLEVNESLNFKAITDPITGDFFEGQTKGDLVYVQQPDGTMELNGSLELVKGKYLFTYQKIIRRPFDVLPGGTVSWTGDPFDPSFNLEVAYEVKTSVYPLLAGTGGANANSSGTALRQTFLVKLNVGGTLNQTKIKTSLEYPQIEKNTNDPEVQAAIEAINRDPNQQNTQAFALILFNGFLSQGLENSDFQIVDISGNINNLITQQLNGLANRYIKFVELDFGIDTSSDFENTTTTNLRVSVRRRFLNDRLTISLDGKTTSETGSEEGTSQSYLDNITVEYALTPDGQFKLKIYNKRDFDDFIGGSGVKVGGALVFSKEFNGIRLFGK